MFHALLAGIGEGVAALAADAVELQPAFFCETEGAGAGELGVDAEGMEEGDEVAEPDAGDVGEEGVSEDGDDEGFGARGIVGE